MTLVVGIDLSSTSTGVCAAGECSTIAPKGELLDRARMIAGEVQPVALSADVLVIEAIGTRHVNTAIAIATVHALVLDRIADLIGPRVVKVSPASLKKWATGKGNANKDQMLLAAVRAGAPVDDNDQADAWLLWTLGEALEGRWQVPRTQYRTDLIHSLLEDPQ